MRIIILIFATIVSFRGISQEMNRFQYVDSITYSQYSHQQYKALWLSGRKAIKNGWDYYYLRMRLGISYYERSNFEKALQHFEKAYQMNPSDSLLTEYLYYSYLYTLRTSEAYCFSKLHQPMLEKKLKQRYANDFPHTKLPQHISATIGYLFNTNFSTSNNDFKQNAPYAENTLQGNAFIGNVFFKQSLSNQLNLYYSASYFNIKSLGVVQEDSTDTKHYSNGVYSFTVGANYHFKNSWTLGGFASYCKEKSKFLSTAFNSHKNSWSLVDINNNNNAFTFGLFSSKRIRNFKIGFSIIGGSLGRTSQYQGEANVVWYPLGNTSFFTNTGIAYLYNQENHQAVFTQKVGVKLSKKLWGNLAASYGNHQNYVADNGINHFNTIDPVWFTGEANLQWQLGKLTLLPAYVYQLREGSYFKYFTPDTFQKVNKKYNNHIIKCTVLWNF